MCNENHDHTTTGECLTFDDSKYAVKSREEKGEALAHMTQDQQAEYIRTVNISNRKKVIELNKSPF